MTAGAIPITIFYLRGVFETIPRDLEEAAKIDGCGTMGVLRHVIVPNSKAGLSVIIVLTFLQSWNNFGLPLVLARDPDAMTIPVGKDTVSPTAISVLGPAAHT